MTPSDTKSTPDLPPKDSQESKPGTGARQTTAASQSPFLKDSPTPDAKRPEHKGLKRFFFFLKILEIRLRFVIILAITALAVGYWDYIQNYYERWNRQRAAQSAHEGHAAAQTPESEFEFFCPMHPFVIRATPGNCPICGMNLVQRRKSEGAAELPEGVLARVQVSPERILQAGVAVEPVVYRLLSRSLRSYGTVETDETRVARIIARFPGRVEQLMADATGLAVKKGDPLARIYSPKFLAAAEEYVQAIAQGITAGADAKVAEDARRANRMADYARQRLALAGFTNEQLDAIAKSGKVDDSITLYSPLSGVILEKNVLLGQMLDESMVLYTIADLSTLWVQIWVLESNLTAVKVGMPVEVTSVSWPGEIFFGTVDFIFPTLNPDNRSIKVRVVVDNKAGKLKPGMYVTAVARSPIGRYGEIGTPSEPPLDAPPPATTNALPVAVADEAASKNAGSGGMKMAGHEKSASSAPASAVPKPSLPTTKQEDADAFLRPLPVGAEYYACPMHPEVVSDTAGNCPKCGMTLEKKALVSEAKKRGFAAFESEDRWAEGYTCPMHVDQLQNGPGVCGICGCGMKLTKWRVERVLSIPETAVIDTGTRQVVYMQSAPGIFDARAVVLGPRAGAYYPVLQGLSKGDLVVSRGSFLIDAETRLNPATMPSETTATAQSTASRGDARPGGNSPHADHVRGQ
jgi:multidrug efflux pump subunit AcrA (membrane-fusion protein)